MKKYAKFVMLLAAIAGIVAVTGWYLSRHMVAVVQPAGQIAHKELNLIILCSVLSGLIVIPVFSLLIYFVWKYREGNKTAKYAPEFEGNWQIETVWWVIPTILLVVISTITWRSSYALDPYKPLSSTKPTLHIQVVAMDWKWLFIYPGEHIARVNAVDIPVGTPVEFDITSDTTMGSFWVPQLGGQMYAMPGMVTRLNLQADKLGDYRGVSANIGGKGFADMKFTVHVLPAEIYGYWLDIMHRLPQHLTAAEYAKLSKPSVITEPTEFKNGYSSVEPNLYDNIVMKSMMPIGDARL
ncbi:MAG TPA: COX aromatic rich motif-containing protein [Candidatus Saccharimonadales bacterium]|nr:COX aromatic rich motif-containing protein [Candidatus Saccharimonadales bacterium]